MSNNSIHPETISPEAARAVEEFLYKAGAEFAKAKLAREIIDIDGEKYAICGNDFERIEKPLPDKIVRPDLFQAFSLDGLIDFIKADVDGFFAPGEKPCIVRVASPLYVEVVTPVTGYWKERATIAVCNAQVPKLAFNQFIDPESFQIMLQSNFEDSDNRNLVLKLSGNLKKEQSLRTADDGVSQKVTINAGVASAADVVVKNPVVLRPIRTFIEVTQPESPFVLRFSENAQVALFDGDGGAWKQIAVARVADYLKRNLEDCNVVVIG